MFYCSIPIYCPFLSSFAPHFLNNPFLPSPPFFCISVHPEHFGATRYLLVNRNTILYYLNQPFLCIHQTSFTHHIYIRTHSNTHSRITYTTHSHIHPHTSFNSPV